MTKRASSRRSPGCRDCLASIEGIETDLALHVRLGQTG